MKDYRILDVKSYHKANGKYLGTVVVIRDINLDELFVGIGMSDHEAEKNALEQRKKSC